MWMGGFNGRWVGCLERLASVFHGRDEHAKTGRETVEVRNIEVVLWMVLKSSCIKDWNHVNYIQTTYHFRKEEDRLSLRILSTGLLVTLPAALTD